MLKILFNCIKKTIVGIILLFGYNVFLSSYGVIIPINVVSIIICSVFDVPGILGLVLFFLINYQ